MKIFKVETVMLLSCDVSNILIRTKWESDRSMTNNLKKKTDIVSSYNNIRGKVNIEL